MAPDDPCDELDYSDNNRNDPRPFHSKDQPVIAHLQPEVDLRSDVIRILIHERFSFYPPKGRRRSRLTEQNSSSLAGRRLASNFRVRESNHHRSFKVLRSWTSMLFAFFPLIKNLHFNLKDSRPHPSVGPNRILVGRARYFDS